MTYQQIRRTKSAIFYVIIAIALVLAVINLAQDKPEKPAQGFKNVSAVSVGGSTSTPQAYKIDKQLRGGRPHYDERPANRSGVVQFVKKSWTKKNSKTGGIRLKKKVCLDGRVGYNGIPQGNCEKYSKYSECLKQSSGYPAAKPYLCAHPGAKMNAECYSCMRKAAVCTGVVINSLWGPGKLLRAVWRSEAKRAAIGCGLGLLA